MGNIRALAFWVVGIVAYLGFPGSTHAKLTSTVVAKILVSFDTNVEVTFADAVRDGASSCRSDIVNQLAFQSNTDVGKAFLSVLLAAKMSGKHVSVSGRVSACSPANLEQLAWVRVED